MMEVLRDGGGSSDVQLMADGCVSLLRSVFGENNWYRWHDLKEHTQLTDFQAFLTWLLDAAEQTLALNTSQQDVPQNEYYRSQLSGGVAADSQVRAEKQESTVANDEVSVISPTCHDIDTQNFDHFGASTSGDSWQLSSSQTTDAEILRLVESDSFYCNACKVSLSDIVVVKEHCKLRHGGSRLIISCFCCSKKFVSIPEYVEFHKQHVAGTHGNKPFVCDHCAKGFNARKELEDHINNKHLRLGPRHECGKCGKKFSHVCNLSRHKKRCPFNTSMDEQVVSI